MKKKSNAPKSGRGEPSVADDGEDCLRERLNKVSLDLRASNGLESREAVISRKRVEYFRGRDLHAYMTEHPDKLDATMQALDVDVSKSASKDAALVQFVELMLHYGLIIRVDRTEADRVPKPGKKGIVKWPKTLQMMRREYQVWDPKGFYTWTTRRPISPLTYLGSFFLVLLVAAVCFFPLASVRLKWVVIYTLWGLLGIIASLVGCRAGCYSVVWLATGRSIWIFPNLFEDVSIKESFAPFVAETKDADGNPGPPAAVWKRALCVVILAAVIGGARTVGPQQATVTRQVKTMNRSVLKFFDMVEREEKKRKIPGGKDEGDDASPPSPAPDTFHAEEL